MLKIYDKKIMLIENDEIYNRECLRIVKLL